MAVSTAVDANAVARVVGIKTEFVNLKTGIKLLPQRIAVIGQGTTAANFSYDTTKAQFFTAQSVGQTYGFGSPLHLAAKQLLPANGDGVGSIPVDFFGLKDDGSGVTAAGTITPSGSQTTAANYQIKVNNILSAAFTVAVGASVADMCDAITAAINAIVDMPIIATDNTTAVGIAAKWDGASGNDIYLEVVGDTTLGSAYAIVQPTGGATNPAISTATDQFGDVWYTLVVNCFEPGDTTTIDALSAFNEGRWGALTRKPFVAFHGNNETTVATAGTIPDARKTDRTNVQINAPGCNNLPLQIAARAVARIAVIAQNDPAMDYGSTSLDGLTSGDDGDQWLYSEKDSAVKLGVSTTDVKDSKVYLSDTVTFYHPDGELPPAYRYVCDFMKIANIIFNLDLIFVQPEWDGAPLIPDAQATTNRNAKKPFMAKSVIARMIDSLALNAIISDPETAKANIVAAINESNPKRLDIATTVQLSGNTNIISIDLDFGFAFGTSPVVA